MEYHDWNNWAEEIMNEVLYSYLKDATDVGAFDKGFFYACPNAYVTALKEVITEDGVNLTDGNAVGAYLWTDVMNMYSVDDFCDKVEKKALTIIGDTMLGWLRSNWFNNTED